MAAGSASKSTSGGASWTAVNIGYTKTAVAFLAIAPSMPATLYAVTYGGAVFKSTNRGASWTACSPLTSTAIGLNKGRGQLIGGHQAGWLPPDSRRAWVRQFFLLRQPLAIPYHSQL